MTADSTPSRATAYRLVYLVRHYSPLLRDKWRDVKALDSAAVGRMMPGIDG